MSHYGPMYEAEDVTGWTSIRLAEWVAASPGWEEAELKSCDCGICGTVVELVRPVPTRSGEPEGAPSRAGS